MSHAYTHAFVWFLMRHVASTPIFQLKNSISQKLSSNFITWHCCNSSKESLFWDNILFALLRCWIASWNIDLINRRASLSAVSNLIIRAAELSPISWSLRHAVSYQRTFIITMKWLIVCMHNMFRMAVTSSGMTVASNFKCFLFTFLISSVVLRPFKLPLAILNPGICLSIENNL